MKTRNYADVIQAKLAADPELKKAVEAEGELARAEQQYYDAFRQYLNGCPLSSRTEVPEPPQSLSPEEAREIRWQAYADSRKKS